MDRKLYLELFLSNYRQNKFENKSVLKVERAGIVPPYYRIIGIHKLLPHENVGKHNLFIDVVDRLGNRIGEKIKWGWEGQKPTEKSSPVLLDKPAYEPAGNIAIWGNQIIWAEVLDKESDRIYNVRTDLPDEGSGNTYGHHSYYVVWMLEDDVPTEPTPGDDDNEIIKQLQQDLARAEEALFKIDTILELYKQQ